MITAPTNTNMKAVLRITRFMDCNARKYSMSPSFPMPGVTAFDQVKKTPVIMPVDSIASSRMIVSAFIVVVLVG